MTIYKIVMSGGKGSFECVFATRRYLTACNHLKQISELNICLKYVFLIFGFSFIGSGTGWETCKTIVACYASSSSSCSLHHQQLAAMRTEAPSNRSLDRHHIMSISSMGLKSFTCFLYFYLPCRLWFHVAANY